jgi:hypothetical protein
MRNILLILLTLSGLKGISQVNFEDITLSEALKKASGNGKLVYVYFVTATCEQCNEVAGKAFESKELGKLYSEKCISLKMDVTNSDRKFFIDQYNPEEIMGSFYLRSDGDLLYRTAKTTTMTKTYMEDLDKAHNKHVEGRNALKQLDEMWVIERSFEAMEMNLNRRNELMLPLDSLLDVYTSLLPEDSLRSFRVIQFVSRMAPKINSASYSLTRKDQDLFNQAWYRMDLKERININHRIAFKTMKEAVAKKDEKLATRVANFIWGVNNSSNESVRRKKYDNTWMNYYRLVDDTAKYLKVATYYYDHNYLNLSTDSLKRADSLETAKRFAAAKAENSGNSNIRMSVTASNIRQMHSAYLVEGARQIYLMDRNKVHTGKVLQYASKALAIYESAVVLDINARLLHNTGKTTEAIAFQEKAIALVKERQLPAERYEKILQKMKLGQPVDL